MFAEVPGPQRDEAELYLAWLEFLRAAVLRDVEGLDEDQVRWQPDGKLIALAGIVNHLAHVEERWMERSFLGGERTRSEEEFHVPVERPFSDVVASYRTAAERTAEVVRGASSLDEKCRHSGYDTLDLRWVLVHLIQETARHAGHADATREMLDGKRGE